jgi:hypothetical protein
VSGVTLFEPGAVIRIDDWRDDGRPVGASSLTILGRLQPGVTPNRVRTSLGIMLPSGRPLDVVVTPLREALTHRMRSLAWGAFGAALLILFVCAGNLANLWLAAAAHRDRELATRAALGAMRRDLLGLWVAEGVVVASIATTFGLAIAAVVLAASARVIPESYAVFGNPSLTLRAFVAALLSALAVVTLALFPVVIRAGRAPFARLDRRRQADRRRDRRLRSASWDSRPPWPWSSLSVRRCSAARISTSSRRIEALTRRSWRSSRSTSRRSRRWERLRPARSRISGVCPA